MGGKRIEYMDALRGFAMLLVVMGHVCSFTFNITSSTVILGTLCGVLQLPLFFMISGFFYYKPDVSQNAMGILKNIIKRFPQLIIAAFLFMSIYCLSSGDSITGSLMGSAKNGYWYTFTLFEFIIIMGLFQLCFSFFGLAASARNVTLIVLALLAFVTFPKINVFFYDHYLTAYGIVGIRNFEYFIAFVFGAIIRVNFKRVICYIRQGKALGIIMAIYLIVAFVQNSQYYYGLPGVLQYTMRVYCMLSSVYVALALFMMVPMLSNDGIIGRGLRTVGNHTLEIYFLHYFFVHNKIFEIGRFFTTHDCPTLESLAAFAVAIVVIAASLMLGAVIRLSPFYSKYLFGIKR